MKRDPQRFFSPEQRSILYEHAEGRCQVCSVALSDGWHADHMIPWADGGPTTVENGQALCSVCNAKKGTGMHFSDTFTPRPFQREVLNRVIERIRERQECTVVLAAPGSGKTLTYQALATQLIREDLIDYVAVFVPRTALAEQCETGWMVLDANKNVRGLCEMFDSAKRLGRVRHRVNETPLTNPNEHGSGFVSTYSALVTNEEMFLRWARRNEGRFLLVADEAQFCGSAGDKEDGGTKAGALIEKLNEYARHTLLLTGTPYRADNKPLILADYEPDPDNPKKMSLVCHAEARYSDGVAEGYLRTFELHRTDARVSKRTLGDPDTGKGDSILEYNLSDDGDDLVPVLRDEKVWQPLVDRVVSRVRDKQKFNRAYRGLISCMQQNDARKVQKYLQQKYPELRVGIAVSSDTDAPQALADFKVQPMDILVTVRMAFIGYDCPTITVVGILTHYRDGGHLMQLVGRGLRVWKDMPARQQSCAIVAPDDPKMEGFLSLLREEQEQGLKLVDEREPAEPDDEPGEAVQQEFAFVESAVATSTDVASNEIDVDADELLLIEGFKVMADSGEDASKLKKILEMAGLMVKQAPTVPAPRTEPVMEETPKTERKQVSEINAKVAEIIRSHLYKRGVKPDSPGYQEAVTKLTAKVNESAQYNAAQANTVDRANRRLRAALAIK
ncbi:DEAD/DEAH box helicase family protein [Streptomyces sp. gCLA4]|uniref:DEAD/DEAH box helicase family protein n=1 Tax=Streptomyces sp. gCLA4 TaxID=1873416 RepID=UPI00287BC69E|nr:DEAD/DEAH box helicase family protein [Streptomyces sp. gCLA4]